MQFNSRLTAFPWFPITSIYGYRVGAVSMLKFKLNDNKDLNKSTIVVYFRVK